MPLFLVGPAIATIGLLVNLFFRYHDERWPFASSNNGEPKLSNSMVWRPSKFTSALQVADEYLDLIADGDSEERDGGPDIADIFGFAESALLTAAHVISPFSVGSANMFRFINESREDVRLIGSANFVGSLPPKQVLFGRDRFRPMQLSEDSLESQSVASQSAVLSEPILGHLTSSNGDSGFKSNYELGVGISHILAIPASMDPPRMFWRQAQPDSLACMTVDLRMHGVVAWLVGPKRRQSPRRRVHGRWLIRRSRDLASRLQRLAQLEAIEILRAEESARMEEGTEGSHLVDPSEEVAE